MFAGVWVLRDESIKMLRQKSLDEHSKYPYFRREHGVHVTEHCKHRLTVRCLRLFDVCALPYIEPWAKVTDDHSNWRKPLQRALR